MTLQLETPGLRIKPGELEHSSCLLQVGACWQLVPSNRHPMDGDTDPTAWSLTTSLTADLRLHLPAKECQQIFPCAGAPGPTPWSCSTRGKRLPSGSSRASWLVPFPAWVDSPFREQQGWLFCSSQCHGLGTDLQGFIVLVWMSSSGLVPLPL